MPDTTDHRRYDAPRRRARAEATRQSVLTAARHLFGAHGIVGTTVVAIAREAGVSPQTIYAVFRSKVGVLLALLDEMEASVDAAAHADAIAAAPSPQEQLRLIVAFHCELFDRGLQVIDLVRRTSSDPEVRLVWEEGQRRRRVACRRWVRVWKDNGSLRLGLKEKTAVDLLWLHCGDDVYAGLVGECGWGRQAVQRWLVESLDAQLLRPASDR